jgi:putative drug exporter of the RND superfamily
MAQLAVSMRPGRVERVGAWCFAHRRTVILVWLAGLVLLATVGRIAGSAFSDKTGGGNTESQRAQDFLAQHFAAQSGDSARVVFHTTSGAVSASAARTAIDATVERIERVEHVVAVTNPFSGRDQISADGSTAYGTIQFDATTDDLSKATVAQVVQAADVGTHATVQVELGGAPISKAERPSLGSSEIVGVVAALVILLIAFGSLVAAGLPILIALLGLVPAFGIIDLLSHGLVVPTFGPELAALVGLGVGIDYALFIVTRYRQRLHDGDEPAAALRAAQATSGRAVLFAGGTVVASLLGLFLLGVPYANGLAIGTIATVVLMIAGALTLLPALLGFAGRNIDRTRVHLPFLRTPISPSLSFWYRWSRIVQRRPAVFVTGSLAILVVLAVPLVSMHLAYTDQGTGTTDLTSRRAYDLVARGFGPGANGPLVVAVDTTGQDSAAAAQSLADELALTRGVARVSSPKYSVDHAAVIDVFPTTAPQDLRTEQLVHRIRDTIAPQVAASRGLRILVGGQTAAAVDASNQFARRLPIVIAFVVLLSFVLLMIVFRSVAVPLKAALMNLLSVGAAYGVIVAVFQWGWLGSFFGIGKTAPIDPWVPLMLFTILFGLSMDYEVFLLSRIREEWLRSHDNATAVADGLASTARVITAAAAIMICVFGSFVLGDIRVLKLFGLGMATAVFVDATLIRVVLVPATMELLGNANWWLPRWLDRLLPTIALEVQASALDHFTPVGASGNGRHSTEPSRS